MTNRVTQRRSIMSVLGTRSAGPGAPEVKSAGRIRWRTACRLAATLIVIAWGSGIGLPRMAHAKGGTGCTGDTDVLTYHNDPQRTGWNYNEHTLTKDTVRPAFFGRIATPTPLDDQVDAQPLVVTNQTIDGHPGARTVVYVATEHNTVYAIDACSGAILKSTNLGQPVPKPFG